MGFTIAVHIPGGVRIAVLGGLLEAVDDRDHSVRPCADVDVLQLDPAVQPAVDVDLAEPAADIDRAIRRGTDDAPVQVHQAAAGGIDVIDHDAAVGHVVMGADLARPGIGPEQVFRDPDQSAAGLVLFGQPLLQLRRVVDVQRPVGAGAGADPAVDVDVPRFDEDLLAAERAVAGIPGHVRVGIVVRNRAVHVAVAQEWNQWHGGAYALVILVTGGECAERSTQAAVLGVVLAPVGAVQAAAEQHQAVAGTVAVAVVQGGPVVDLVVQIEQRIRIELRVGNHHDREVGIGNPAVSQASEQAMAQREAPVRHRVGAAEPVGIAVGEGNHAVGRMHVLLRRIDRPKLADGAMVAAQFNAAGNVVDVLHGHQHRRAGIVAPGVVEFHRRHAAGRRLGDLDIAGAAGSANEVDVAARVVRDLDRAHQQVAVALVDHLDAGVALGVHRAAAGNAGAVQEHIAARCKHRREHPGAAVFAIVDHVRQRLQRHAAVGGGVAAAQAVEEVSGVEAAQPERIDRQPGQLLQVAGAVDPDLQLVVAAGHHVAIDDDGPGGVTVGIAAALGHRDEAELVAAADAVRRQVQCGFRRADGHVAGAEHLAVLAQHQVAVAGHIHVRSRAGYRDQTAHVAFGVGDHADPAVHQSVAVAAGQDIGVAQRFQLGRVANHDAVPVVDIDIAARTADRGQPPGVHQRRGCQHALGIGAQVEIAEAAEQRVAPDLDRIVEVGFDRARHYRHIDRAAGAEISLVAGIGAGCGDHADIAVAVQRPGQAGEQLRLLADIGTAAAGQAGAHIRCAAVDDTAAGGRSGARPERVEDVQRADIDSAAAVQLGAIADAGMHPGIGGVVCHRAAAADHRRVARVGIGLVEAFMAGADPDAVGQQVGVFADRRRHIGLRIGAGPGRISGHQATAAANGLGGIAGDTLGLDQQAAGRLRILQTVVIRRVIAQRCPGHGIGRCIHHDRARGGQTADRNAGGLRRLAGGVAGDDVDVTVRQPHVVADPGD